MMMKRGDGGTGGESHSADECSPPCATTLASDKSNVITVQNMSLSDRYMSATITEVLDRPTRRGKKRTLGPHSSKPRASGKTRLHRML
ncbi:hypothetical protein EYF80_003440 [Liparis tanakae]|uniref:Uncharacterized protein n=1 Tax=Liparis tanakae TaxID=230148 RepID=A0A4Z2J7P1_9TELE|nr:hypothetical protein EYF80_003440 [Liparis tanakae]